MQHEQQNHNRRIIQDRIIHRVESIGVRKRLESEWMTSQKHGVPKLYCFL